MAEILEDDAIILQVKNWQDVNKYAICFTREHGKVRFIAYGARYTRNVQGRLLQPFAKLHIELQLGQRIDKLRNCELLSMPQEMDMRQVGYAAVGTELTSLLTEDRQAQPELYVLLEQTLTALKFRNPRLVILSFAIKLLKIVGLAPQITACVNCGLLLENDADVKFSCQQGGALCSDCSKNETDVDLDPCNFGLRQLWQWLEKLDYFQPAAFDVWGRDLMALEKILYKFIYYQIDKPLNSLKFLHELQL